MWSKKAETVFRNYINGKNKKMAEKRWWIKGLHSESEKDF